MCLKNRGRERGQEGKRDEPSPKWEEWSSDAGSNLFPAFFLQNVRYTQAAKASTPAIAATLMIAITPPANSAYEHKKKE